MDSEIEVEIIQTSDPSKITLGSRPIIIRGLPVGPCLWLWKDVEYLRQRIPQDKRVTVHVSQSGEMNFLKKNFQYKTLSFHSFLNRCTSKSPLLTEYFLSNTEKYYLRALGDDPRKEAALFEKHFPDLARDVHIPNIFFRDRLFSTVLRGGSAGVRLWTHYDVMDNILIQIVGRKTVVLFDPEDAPYLYMNGDKSEVIDVDHPDLARYPLFAKAKRYRARMVPGDILFIPALWFHNVVAEDFSLAVNAFWRSTAIRDENYDTKDVYENADLLPAQRAFQTVEKAMQLLEELPERYARFYAVRCMDAIRKRAQLPRFAFDDPDDEDEFNPDYYLSRSLAARAFNGSTSISGGGNPAAVSTPSSFFDMPPLRTSSSISAPSVPGAAAAMKQHAQLPDQSSSTSSYYTPATSMCYPSMGTGHSNSLFSPPDTAQRAYPPEAFVSAHGSYHGESFIFSSSPYSSGLGQVFPDFLYPSSAPDHRPTAMTDGGAIGPLSILQHHQMRSRTMVQQQQQQREKKMLHLADPFTGETISTSQKVDDGTSYGLGSMIQTAPFGNHDGGPYLYDRQRILELRTSPFSKRRPKFSMTSWSTNDLADVFLLKDGKPSPHEIRGQGPPRRRNRRRSDAMAARSRNAFGDRKDEESSAEGEDGGSKAVLVDVDNKKGGGGGDGRLNKESKTGAKANTGGRQKRSPPRKQMSVDHLCAAVEDESAGSNPDGVPAGTSGGEP